MNRNAFAAAVVLALGLTTALAAQNPPQTQPPAQPPRSLFLGVSLCWWRLGAPVKAPANRLARVLISPYCTLPRI